MTVSSDRKTVRAVYALTLGGTFVWLAAIFLAPELAARGQTAASRLLYAVFSPVCHQIPGRCFALRGLPLAVCGRCLGVYAGFAAGLAFFPLVRGFSRLALPPARLFLVAVLPLALDGLGGLLGLWASPIGVRFVTGFAWGTVLPVYFVTGLADLVLTRRRRRAERNLEMTGGPS